MPRARTSKSSGTGAKLIPHPIFDTQVAAMVLGYGDSISYDQLVQRITGDALDKSHRFTDWTRRPLSEAQLSYAISDVTHLRDVYLALVDDLGAARPRRLGAGGDERADLARHLPHGAGERLAAAEDARAQAEGARRADRGRRLARARGAVARRAALARAQGRRDRRHRGAGADHAPSSSATCARCPRASSARAGARRSSPRSSAGWRATRKRCRGRCACSRRPNGAAIVELLKVLLRMISERHHVAAKVIATVDDLERIAADDDADVPALPGWRRELFGEKALALKHGELALAIERGKVAAVRDVERPPDLAHQHHRLAADQARERAQPAEHALAGERGEFAGKPQRQPVPLDRERRLRQHAGHRRGNDIGEPQRRAEHAGAVEHACRSELAQPRREFVVHDQPTWRKNTASAR